MAVKEQIEAINAGAGTLDEKRAARYQLKCQSLADALAPFVGNTYRYQGVDYTIYAAKAEQLNGTWVLRIIVRGVVATGQDAGAVVLPLVWNGQPVEHVYVNPPILNGSTEDLVTVGRELLRQALARFGG